MVLYMYKTIKTGEIIVLYMCRTRYSKCYRLFLTCH
jgi:hypothetical protein